MWQSATASIIALALQQHLLFGGLGEAIAVIVGGVVSVIALRKARQSTVRPAPVPRPAPASPRTAAPPAYGEPAPPTTPDRRLHPGPIALSAPTPRPARADGDEGDEGEHSIATSLFNPEIILGNDLASADNRSPTPPVLRPLGQLSAEWRAAQSSSSPSSSSASAPLNQPSHVAFAPIWNHAPFARPASVVRLALDLAPEAGATILPPIWRAPVIAEPSAPAEWAVATPETRAPVWSSWLGAARMTDAASVETLEALSEVDITATDQSGRETQSAEQAPIWSSFLRPE